MTRNNIYSNPSDYPRTYQSSIAKRSLIFVFGTIVLLFGGALSYFSWVLWSRHQDVASAGGIAALALPILLLSAKLIMEAARAKFILQPDGIENYSAFSTRSLRRDEIEGYTMTRAGGTPAIEFWPKQSLVGSKSGKKMIRVFVTFPLNSLFKHWMSGLQNLDEKESKSGAYIYSSPLSPEARAVSAPGWFPQKLILYPTVALTAGYSLIAAFSPRALEWLDLLVTPLTHSLDLIGLGINKPPIDGPMPERFYVNIVGLGVWGIVAYNAASIWWMANGKGFSTLDRKVVWQRMKVRFGPVGAWLALPVHLLFYALLVAYSALALLNGINGWFAFHVKDFVTPVFVVMTFVFPGAFLAALCFPLMRSVVLAVLNRPSS